MSAPLCEHKWRWVSDWYGDPTIPNGTVDCSRMQCELCDEIDEEAEKPEPDADCERDRRRDDAA